MCLRITTIAILALALAGGAAPLNARRQDGSQSQASASVAAQPPASKLPARIDAKAQPIIDRTIQALGGPAFLNARTLTTHGSLGTSGGGVVYFDSQLQFPDKRRLAYGLNKKDKPIIIINNGDRGWEIDRMGMVHLDSKDIRLWRFANRYSLENLLRLRIHEPGTLVQVEGVDFVDEVPVNVLDIVDATETQIKLYINKLTGLPVQISYRRWNSTTNDWDDYDDIYGDYQTFQGIATAQHISHLINERRVSEVYRDRDVYNQDYPTSLFADPGVVQ